MRATTVGLVSACVIAVGSAVWAGAGSPDPDRLSAPDSGESNHAIATSYTSGRLTFDGGSPSDSTAVSETLAGLDQDLLSVHVGEAPKDEARRGRWFFATVEDADGPLPVSLWEADLAQGAVAERLAGDVKNLGQVIVGSSIETDDGTFLGGGAGDVESGQSFGSGSVTDAEVVSQVRATLDSFGLAAEEVRVLRPFQAAVLVRIEVAHPSLMRGQFGRVQAALAAYPDVRFEGLYLEVSSPKTGPLAISSVAFRSGAGRYWSDPAYAAAVGELPH